MDIYKTVEVEVIYCILWTGTHRTTTAYVTLQTLNNFNLHYFIIIHYYPILFYIIIQNQNFNPNYIFLIYVAIVTNLTTIIFWYYHLEDDRITGRNMLVEILYIKTHKIKVHLLVFVYFINLINARNLERTEIKEGTNNFELSLKRAFRIVLKLNRLYQEQLGVLPKRTEALNYN